MGKMFKSIQGPIGRMLFGEEEEEKPEVKAPTPLADPEDPRLKILARRNAASRSAGSGRDSTRLSGAGSFSSTQL